MPINFPDFKNSHCFWLAACGTAQKIGPNLADWMKTEQRKFANFKTERGDAQVKLTINSGGPAGNHIHIDVCSPEIVVKKMNSKQRPFQKVNLEEFQTSIEPLLGQEIVVNLKAGYRIKLEELPETGIIRSFVFETKMGNVSLKLDGAQFSIEGAPVQNISWNGQPDKSIAVVMEADSVKTILSEKYLINGNEIMEQAFNVFVMGKAQNAAA